MRNKCYHFRKKQARIHPPKKFILVARIRALKGCSSLLIPSKKLSKKSLSFALSKVIRYFLPCLGVGQEPILLFVINN